MGYIFVGFSFIFFNININIGSSVIELMPAFIGYILIHKGLRQLSSNSVYFSKVRPLTVVFIIYTAVIFVLNIFGIQADIGWLSIILCLISTCASLYISYNIILGLFEIEQKRMTDLNAAAVKSKWTILAVSQIIFAVSAFYPILMIICAVITVIFMVLFLAEFSKAKNLYNALSESYEDVRDEDTGDLS